MARHAGQNLEDLLRAAAPDGRPDSFAEGVVRAVRGRRRLRRVRWLAAGAAAVALIAFCYSTYVALPTCDETVSAAEPPIPPPARRSPEAKESVEEESFAVQLPATGVPGPSMMMAQIDGATMVVGRPQPRGLRRPAMSGSIAPDATGDSFAIQFR